MPLSVADRAQAIEPRVVCSPWPEHEYVMGFGAFSVPSASGEVLALRAMPQNTVMPYVSVWHRNSAGAWTIYVNVDNNEVSCPKYYGPGARAIVPAAIELRWTGPDRLEVDLARATRGGERVTGDALLQWSMRIGTNSLLRVMSAVNGRMPLATWKSDALVRSRERSSERLLGMGKLTLRGTTPSGHLTTLCPRRTYLVTESHAVLDGRDLGEPVRLPEAPTIGRIGLPARPTFAFGAAFFRRR